MKQNKKSRQLVIMNLLTSLISIENNLFIQTYDMNVFWQKLITWLLLAKKKLFVWEKST